jgi:hypothetical protein
MALSGYIHHHHHHLFFLCYCFSFFLLLLPISSFTTTTITLGRFWDWDWDWDWVGLWNGMDRNGFEFGFGQWRILRQLVLMQIKFERSLEQGGVILDARFSLCAGGD